MKAIYKHELASYFTGIAAYVFGAFILLFNGIYLTAYNLSSTVVNYEYAVGSMSMVFILAIPILTMRSLAEEKRQKTDQLLYALPLSMTDVVLGKYLALLTVLAAPVLSLCLWPLVLSQYGDINMNMCYFTIIAFFLLGAALMAIGMFLSSLVENQAVAAGLSVCVMLLLYFLSGLADLVSQEAFASFLAFFVLGLVLAVVLKILSGSTSAAVLLGLALELGLTLFYLLKPAAFEGLFPNVMVRLSLFDRFYDVIDGVFSLSLPVFDLSVVGLFLFFTVQSMEKRRWK